MSLSSLSGAPLPGRQSMQNIGGGSAPLSNLSGAPNLSGSRNKPTFPVDDDDDSDKFPTSSKGRTRMSPASKNASSVRQSTPNPPTVRFEDDDDLPKATMKKAAMKKTGSFAVSGKSPFDDDDDWRQPLPSKSNPFGDDKPGTSRTGASPSASTRPSATNPAFKWDDDSPPRTTNTGAGKPSASKGLFGDDLDFLSDMNPDSVFNSKKADDPLARTTGSAVRTSMQSRPTGPKADSIFNMLKDEPPAITPDLELDLFGGTASKPAAGPRAGRRAAGVQQSTELSREPTPEPMRPTPEPEPSPVTARNTGGAFDRSNSAPRGSYPGEDFGDAPPRISGIAPGLGRGRAGNFGVEASSTSPLPRGGKPGGGDGGEGVELDGDDLPGLGSPAMLSKNTSSMSVHSGAAAAQVAGRRTPPPKLKKEEDSWEMDDNLLPDDSGTPPAPAIPPRSPPAASTSPQPSAPAASSGYVPSAAGGSSGYTPSASAPSSGYTPSAAGGTSGYVPSAEAGRSRLQHTTFGGQKKDDEEHDELSTGGYTPSFGSRRPASGTSGLGGGLGGGLGASTDYGAGGGLSGSALTPGGPGAPRARRQMGSVDTSPLASLMGGGPLASPKPGAPAVKKTKEEEERERIAAAAQAGLLKRQLAMGATGAAPASPPMGAGSSSIMSPSPIRAGVKPAIGGFGNKPGLSLSDSSDDDLPLPDKATSPPLNPKLARKAGAPPPGHQPQRATTTSPLNREPFDSRVASSVPEMGTAAAGAARGSVPMPGPGSIVQSSAPTPPLHPEVSYPTSINSPTGHPMSLAQPSAASQPSQLSVNNPAAGTPNMERSGTSLGSQPSNMGFSGTASGPVGTLTAQASGAPGFAQQQNLPPGTSAGIFGLPPGVTAMHQQTSGLPPGVTAMQQQTSGLPPGVTAMQQQTSGLPPGVTAMHQQASGLPPGVTAIHQQASGLPPGVTAMHQQASGLPPGVTAMHQQASGLPPGVTAMHQQGLPPGVTDFTQKQALPPGVTAMQHQQGGLPPGASALAMSPGGLLPGVEVMGQQGLMQQNNMPPGVTGFQPGMNTPQQRQQQPQGYSQAQGLSGYGSGGSRRRMSPDQSNPNIVQPTDMGQGGLQQQQQMQPQQQQQAQMSTAFTLPSDPNAAATLARLLPVQSGGMSVNLAQTPTVPLDSIKESLVKGVQEEFEKMSKQTQDSKLTYEKHVADLRAEHERQLHDARAQYDRQLSEARTTADRQVEEARATHRKQLEDTQAGHERQLEEVRRRLERQAEEARVLHERQVAEAWAQRDKAIEDARVAQQRLLEDSRNQHHKALEDTRALHDKVLSDTQALHVKQVLELKNLYEAELRRAAHDVARAVDDTRRVAEEARRQEAEARRAKEDMNVLRDRVLGLETELRARDTALRESETRLVQLDTRSKTELAEAQANAIKEAALMKLEMEDAKAALARVRQQYEEAATAHSQELARYRAELEAQRVMASEELQRAKLATSEQVAAAEARGRRAGMLDKEIAEATIRQQMVAIAEEKEVVSRHRLSAELLAQLTEKVRAVAISSIEREERALSAMERDVADREGRLAAREKLLGEREGRVAKREQEADGLRSDLQNLMVTLESSAVHDREDLKREQLRLSREAVRIEAVTASLQAEREDMRTQLVMEKRLLEEARESRRREREELLTEMATQRQRLATEYADTQRQLDAARNELLAVRSRLVDMESRCSVAATHASEEEKRLETLRLEVNQMRAALETETTTSRNALDAEIAQARAAVQAEVARTRQALHEEVTQTRDTLHAEVTQAHEDLRESKKALRVKLTSVDLESRELVEYAARLQAQSSELAAQAADTDARNSELTAALAALSKDKAELHAAQNQLEHQRMALENLKKSLERERMAIAEERRAALEERLAASRAADVARTDQLRLTEAVRAYTQQGVPIPFALDGSTSRLKTLPPVMPSVTPDRHQSGKRRSHRPAARSRNALKHVLDRLGVDAAMAAYGSTGAGAGGISTSSYVCAQQDFLEKMRLSAPAGVSGLTGMTKFNNHQHSSSPVPPGLNPALLPPGLAAMHSRTAAVTPVKHTTKLPVNSPEHLESERPSPAPPPILSFAEKPASPLFLHNADDYNRDLVDQGEVSVIQLALKKSIHTSSSKVSDAAGLGSTAPGSRQQPRNPNRPRRVGDNHGISTGSSMMMPQVPKLDLSGLSATGGGSGADETGVGPQVASILSSDIASVLPISSSSTSLDLLEAPRAESPDIGALGPRLDTLAQELSSSTGLGHTPANTLGSRFPFGASIGSEEAFRSVLPSAARQQHLGELAAMSELLAARLEALGLGERGPSSRAGPAGYETHSVISSDGLSSRLGLGAAPGAATGSGAAGIGGLSRNAPRRQSAAMSSGGLGGSRLRASGPDSVNRSLAGDHMGTDGGMDVSQVAAVMRSTADTALFGSANTDTLQAFTITAQGSYDGDDADGLSPIASVNMITEDEQDDDVTAMLP